MDYIKEIIETFVKPDSKQRLLYLLSKPKRHDEIIWQFHDSGHFDERCVHPIDPNSQTAEKIYSLMKSKGATEKCFAFSAIKSLQGEVLLKDALDECVGMTTETILYCPQTKVGYWEGGHAKYRAILHKKLNSAGNHQ